MAETEKQVVVEIPIPIPGEEEEEEEEVEEPSSNSKPIKIIDASAKAKGSPEISSWYSPTNTNTAKPPKVPTTTTTTNVNDNLTRRRSLARSVYSKPKSRFGEPSYPLTPNDHNNNNKGLHLQEQLQTEASPNNYYFRSSFSMATAMASPNNKSARTVSVTHKTPLMSSLGDDDQDEEIYRKVVLSKEKHRRLKTKVLVELTVFVCILVCLVASLTLERSKNFMVWGLEFWKWKKVLYFVHGLKKSVQVFIWLGLVLLTWVFLFNGGVQQSKIATKILDYVTWTLVSLLIGAFLWLLKILLLKILASKFHVNTFFDRIQESIFHQYVLQTLSGPPLIEQAERVGRSPSTGQLSFRSTKNKKNSKGGKEKEVIDMAKLHKMKQEKVSAWTMKVLADAVMSSGLSTISNALDVSVDDGGGEQMDKEITNEMEATAAAYHIFMNVAESGSKYIDEYDFLRFMIKEEVDLVFPLFEGADTGRIDRKALTYWVVKIYKGRKALAHALNDTKTAVKQLNKLVTVILIVVTVIVWLLLMEIATTKVLVFFSSQLVVAAFMFGNTCKTIFEAIIFVFVMHPFDVGDRCVIDGVQMMVEEMNILTTVFLKLNNEKVYYPNSVLATKPIINYYRSPDMGDYVEFSIDFVTPIERIGMLKDKIKTYLEKNPQHWYPNHNVLVKEIENVNKIKMGLYVFHTMNFQDFGEKNRRRTELVIEIKKIFEELNIRYNLLPQDVHLLHIGSETTNAANK
ncbi:hypothetical protein CMV_020671 [Castanea mollissima]|uniref:Mechanosensitive ion channel protein n=1 Tax=Castanea mollissima TaxID=60419 RepID=A0A8J4VDD9_9ROSI|nr:hypothetical protein CMV_020671 [Castanea mollissima]